MIMLEPCRYCGKKDAITIIDKEYINAKPQEIRHRFTVICNRCQWSVQGVFDNQDGIRAVWNGMNRRNTNS